MEKSHPFGSLSGSIILGCGYTGQVLARKLSRLGVAVRATTRDPDKAAAIEALGAEAVVWQAPEPVEADTAFVLFPPRGLEPAEVAAALRGVRRVVYCSSTSVYGNQEGGWVTEDTPTAPLSPWGHARVAAEDVLRAQGAVIVRAAGIYGPGRSILDRFRAGRVRVTGDLQRPVNMIHVDDLATILIAAALKAEPGQTLLAATGLPVPWIEMAQTAAKITGVPVPQPTPLPDDPNIRMFYTETKRCRPTQYGRLGVKLAHPDTLESLRNLQPIGTKPSP